MALRIELIGNNLVITDTGDSSVKFERPAADVYAAIDPDKFKIITRTDRADVLYSHDYTGLVNAAGTALDKAALTTFCRTSLGFKKGGSSSSNNVPSVVSVGDGSVTFLA